ncbi:MAG: hypothetical protein KBT63_02955 [Porticoccaceae bacterium]|nr:hypothetical protein [Porticoccaceae bacterium]
MKVIVALIAFGLMLPTFAADTEPRCTSGVGKTEMMEAYALMVNTNGLLCARLNKICTTSNPDVLRFVCKESRTADNTIEYWYHQSTGKVLPR